MAGAVSVGAVSFGAVWAGAVRVGVVRAGAVRAGAGVVAVKDAGSAVACGKARGRLCG